MHNPIMLKLGKFALWVIVALVLLIVGTAVAWQISGNAESLVAATGSLAASVESYHWWFVGLRLGLLYLCWRYWPRFVIAWFPIDLPGYKALRATGLSLRTRIVVLFLVLEVCLHVSYLMRTTPWV